jgi:thymidine kinase
MSKLYFRYGAMGCGKTMQLLQVAFNYEERGHKVLVMKPKTDTKNGEKLLTRIGPEREVDFCFTKDDDLFELVSSKYLKGKKKVACVLVDEAQFLTMKQVDDLMRVVTELDIPVMAYGLRLNFRLTDGGFEGATRLLQIAQDIDEIKTICECGRKATCNARFLNGKFVADGPDVLIDDGKTEIEYRAICPKCFADYKAGRK